MKILVSCKQVINAYVKMRPNKEHDALIPANQRFVMNPFDEIAIEESVRLKEKHGHEVIVVSLGTNDVQEVLKKALAMGADSARHILSEEVPTTLEIAKAFAQIVKKEKIDIVIMGKQSVDGDHNHTGQMLAAILGWPQGTFISELEMTDTKVLITREVDHGLEKLELSLPAVITTDLRLNEPRYPSLPNILKAKKKIIEIIEYSSFNIPKYEEYTILRYDEPPTRTEGVILANVDELISKLDLKSKVN